MPGRDPRPVVELLLGVPGRDPRPVVELLLGVPKRDPRLIVELPLCVHGIKSLPAERCSGQSALQRVERPPLNNRRRTIRKDNKQKRIKLQERQPETLLKRSTVKEQDKAEQQKQTRPAYRGHMCPANTALLHPAANQLMKYATEGCPARTGADWTLEQLEEAVRRAPHSTSLVPEAIQQHLFEVEEKGKMGQVKIIDWELLKRALPPKLNILSLVMVPNKSRLFRVILFSRSF